jgi:hypothetical protein
MTLAFLTWAIFLARLVVKVLAQPPAQGIQLGDPENDRDDIRFPLAVSQYEPILIWYNGTGLTRHSIVTFATPELNETETSHDIFFQITPPLGNGYMEWIRNIPAG